MTSSYFSLYLANGGKGHLLTVLIIVIVTLIIIIFIIFLCVYLRKTDRDPPLLGVDQTLQSA